MITLLSGKYGKIGAGTYLSERGKSKTALALRPFTYGRYEIFKGRDSYSINGAETIKGFYSIGEDIEGFFAASAALELTDLILPEEQPAPEMLGILIDLLSLLERRKSSCGTLLAAFRIKALRFSGCAPELKRCVFCGARKEAAGFSVSQGGMVCEACKKKAAAAKDFFEADAELTGAIGFMEGHALKNLEGLVLKPELEKRLNLILKAYYACHLGIAELKSERSGIL